MTIIHAANLAVNRGFAMSATRRTRPQSLFGRELNHSLTLQGRCFEFDRSGLLAPGCRR